MKNVARDILGQGFWLTTELVVKNMTVFLAMIVITRNITKTEFAVFALYLLATSTLTQIVAFSLGPLSFSRIIKSPHLARQYIRTIIAIRLIVWPFASVFFFLLIIGFDININSTIFITVLAVVFCEIFTINRDIDAAIGNVTSLAIGSLVYALVTFIAFVIIKVLFVINLENAFFAIAAGRIATAMFFSIKAYKLYGFGFLPNRDQFFRMKIRGKTLSRAAFHLLISTLLITTLLNIPIYFLGYFGFNEHLADYYSAQRIFLIIILIPSFLSNLIFRNFVGRHYADHDILKITFSFYTIFFLGITFMLSQIGVDLLTYIFGSEYATANTFLTTLCIVALLQAYRTIYIKFFIKAGKTRWLTQTTVVSFLVAFIISYLLSVFGDPSNILIGVLVGESFAFLMSVFLYSRYRHNLLNKLDKVVKSR